MGEWHLSKYTLFYHPPDHNFMIAVNLMRGSFTILKPEELNILFNFNKIKEKSLFKKFIKQGLIVNYNELSMLDSMAKYRCNNPSVSLTICPTLNCNFDCPYCFERHSAGKMNEETQNKIVEFAEKIINISNSKGLFICWYGGEPLLAFDVIQSLSDKLIKMCEDKKIKYGASIITNGYLLTQKIVDILNEKKIKNYQITIDGIEETHNKTRRLVNGGGTFEKISENLQNLKINGHISIRHNVHSDNINEVNILKKFIEILAKQSGNDLHYYPAIVANNAPERREGQVKILSEEEKCDLILFDDNKIFTKGKPNYCGAQLMHNFTIDNEGRLYKCWEDVDKHERSFGSIYNWNPLNPFFSCTNLDILTSYLNLSACPEDEECRQCIWLPLCRGGCPSKRMFFQKNCVPYKNNPDYFLSKITKKIIEKWDKEHNEQEKSRTN